MPRAPMVKEWRDERGANNSTAIDKPALNATTVRPIAITDKTSVVITIDTAATERSRSCQETVQGLRGAAPAGIFEALGVIAILPAFRCIYAVETDALARDSTV